MTPLQYFFWTTCVICFAIAVRYGERDEKRGMIAILVGSWVTTVVVTIANQQQLDVTFWLLLVDACVLLVMVRLMFDSQKYWPIWVASIQLISVTINVLDLLVSKTLPAAFDFLYGFWVYPMFFAIMAGVYGSHVAMRRNQAQ